MKIPFLLSQVVTHSCAYSETSIHEGVFQMFSVRPRREKKTCCNRLLSTIVDDMQSVQHNHARRKGDYSNEGSLVVSVAVQNRYRCDRGRIVQPATVPT